MNAYATRRAPLVLLTAILVASPYQMTLAVEQHAPMIIDIVLGEGGLLRGHVSDAQGGSLRETGVSLARDGREVANTTTNERGDFSARGLRGGVYQVSAGGGSQLARLWAPGTAPPSARDSMLVVTPSPTILGQYPAGTLGRAWECLKYPLTKPLVFGGIVAAAVAIPVAIHNRNKDSGS